MHEHSSFVTLTYDGDRGPIGTLVPKHMTDWLKRFRYHYSGKRIRYFYVGEYGEVHGRPHYHVALFGHPCCPFIVSRDSRKQCLCEVCKPVFDTWAHGRVQVDGLSIESAQYIAGYVTKKMTSAALKFDRDGRVAAYLKGRHPEFSRPSRRPGIGALAMEVLAQRIEENGDVVLQDGDVPMTLMHGKRRMPLGRYLRDRLRKEVGLEFQKEVSLQKYLSDLREAELFEMQEAYKEGGAQAYQKLIRNRRLENLQSVSNIESKYKIFKSKGSL